MKQVFPNGNGVLFPNGFGDLGAGLNTGSVFTESSDQENWVQTATVPNAIVIPTAGVISVFKVRLDDAITAGTVTFTVVKNLVNTSLAVSFSVGEQLKEDAVNTVSVSAGDKLSINFDETAGVTPDTAAKWSLRFTPTVANEAVATGHLEFPAAGANFGLSGTTRSYNHILSPDNSWSTTESNMYLYCPLAGTIKTFYLYVTDDNFSRSGTGSFTFSLYKNGAEEATTILSFDETYTTGTVLSATGLSISFSADDTLTISGIRSGTLQLGPGVYGSWGILYNPTTDNESIIGGMSGSNLSTTQNDTQYGSLVNARSVSGTENNFKALVNEPITIKNLRVNLGTAPGASQTREFKVRKNGANGNGIVTITGASTSGTDGSNTDVFAVEDMMDISLVATTASAAATNAFWSAILVTVPDTTILARPIFFK